MSTHIKKTRLDKPKFLLQGALAGLFIGFFLVTLFLWKADPPKPEWGDYWQIRPFIIVPLASALGGFMALFLITRPNTSIAAKLGLIVLALVGYIVALWMGIVLGFDGTHWD